MVRALRDLFGPRRRANPRIEARWFIDVQLPKSDKFVGFFTRDVSTIGLRLVGDNSESFQRVLSNDGAAKMRLRIPEYRRLLPLVDAELKWGMGPEGNFQTGWRFAQVAEEVHGLLETYIDTHSDQIIEES